MTTILYHRLAIFLLLMPVVASANDWPGFGGPDRTFQCDTKLSVTPSAASPSMVWRRELGDGLSGIVVADEIAYATYLCCYSESEKALPESQRTTREAIVAMDRLTGKTQWEFQYDAGWLEEQEAFGGRVRSPQATPLVVGDRLITIGFTGIIYCFDRHTGAVVWTKNLPKEFHATPVQFGFSASPIMHKGQLLVLVGGQAGGLVSLDMADGHRRWSVPCDEASYATPMVVTLAGIDQCVFVTLNQIVGVNAETGGELWKFDMPQSGLTNVPTPLWTGGNRIVVSGQGIGGTLELRIVRDGDDWEVEKGWLGRSQFFYCNWIAHQGVILGCNGDLLLALSQRDGKLLGRWRGFAESNLVRSGEKLFVIDGDGVLSILRFSTDKLDLLSRHRLFDERSWTPPALVDDCLYCRAGHDVACVAILGTEEGDPLPSVRISQKELSLRASQETGSEESPVGLIVEAFESKGPEAAWQVYIKLRQNHPERFSLEQRHKLAELACDHGLVDFAKGIVDHIRIDFPKSDEARQMIETLEEQMPRRPSEQTSRGDNGLLYVEIAVRNNSLRFLQTEVKGPAEHPFGYGIPFPPGKVRNEKWPVGTQLFGSDSDGPQQALLKVKADDAGKQIDLFRGTVHQ